MPFDRDRLLRECELAVDALDQARMGNRDALAETLDGLMSYDEQRNHYIRTATLRAEFVRKNPGAAAPLAAFDEVLGRVMSKGADHWLDPANKADLVELAAKGAVLRKALGGVAVVQKMRDPATEERDHYIYEQVMAGVPHKDTMKAVNGHEGWRKVGSPEGIKDRAVAYADRHGLTRPKPRRTRGGGSK
jgi:hypothetical protein